MAIVFIRTLIIYLTLLITMRLLGKRQMGEMELSEFVLAALSADLAAHPLQDIGIPMINGIVPVLTLFGCEILIAGIGMKSIRFRGLLFGKPSLLIENGKIIQKQMQANRFTPEELMQELRTQGYYDISRVKYAILETDGTLNVMPYPADKPASAAMLGIAVDDVSYPSIVISDGHVLEKNLSWLGFDIDWLKNTVQGKPESIYLMIADKQGRTFIAWKEDLHEP